MALEIDHVVALAEAWRSGASAWTGDQRRAFANDLDFAPSLAAVTGALNQAKADKDVAEWLPPQQGARCRYAVEWLQVKYRWDLAVDQAEKSALVAQLQACGNAPVEVPVKGGVPGSGTAPASGHTMTAGQVLLAGQWMVSADRTHGLTLQADGDLVAYGPGDRGLWSSGTGGNPGARLMLQPDGNLVIHAADGRVLWHAGTHGNPGSRLTVQDDGNVVLLRAGGSPAWFTGWDRTGLRGGQALYSGQQITSANGRYRLLLQRDGNLVTYGPGGRPVFFTGTYGADSLQLQPDGNLVAYRPGAALWATGTWRDGRTRLEVQDDGNVVLYRADGTPAWYSGWDTGARATTPSSGRLVAAPVAPRPAAPAPARAAAPPSAPAPPASASYANCAAVRAAGKAPLRAGQPGYRAGLDRDGDGVACE